MRSLNSNDGDLKSQLSWGHEELQDMRLLAYGYLREGHYDKAVTIFEALVIIEKEVVYDQQTLGALYVQTGQHERAVPQLRRALELKDNHLPTLLNLAKALFATGDKQEGFTVAKRLMRCRNRQIANNAEALVIANSDDTLTLLQPDADLPQ